MTTTLFAPAAGAATESAADEAPASLLDALFFAQETGLAFEVRADVLVAKPASEARRHADRISAMKPLLARLYGPWHAETAAQIMTEAHARNAARLRGRLVEVLEYAQADRPELWQAVEAAYRQIDDAFRAGDRAAFLRGICDHCRLYDDMLTQYLESK